MKNIRKMLLVLIMLLFTTNTALAFLYDVPILTKEEIAKLSDQALEDTFIDAAIEIETSKTFHGKAGFTPKEYTKHKELLRYIVNLKMEYKKRELELPPVDNMIE